MQENLKNIEAFLNGNHCQLVAVTKTHPVEVLWEAYRLNVKVFGENKVQEMVSKYEALPKDIEWHMIGHLQRNKVKYIAPFVHLIHSVDSFALLEEIDKQAKKNERVIPCLLQIHIATEESKFGMDYTEAEAFLRSKEVAQLQNIQLKGLMGMATHTKDEEKIREEFRTLKLFFDQQKVHTSSNVHLDTLSMGMSHDYKLAVEEGSTMVRIGSALFGNRDYN